MDLRDLRLKFKAFRLGRRRKFLQAFRMRRFLIGIPRKKRRESSANTSSWMAPVTHGYHVAGDQSRRSVWEDSDNDSVVAQREQIQELELWFFGVFDPQIGDKVTKFMQTHFFDKKFKESQMERKAKETMKKAHYNARTKIAGEAQKDYESGTVGSASALVINGKKLVIASMGDYRAVVCEDGFSHQISCNQQRWPRRFILGSQWGKFAGIKAGRSSGVVVAAESVYSETEFVILASSGIWEVMKNQEAVNLIRHIEDPHQAAECLAKEAVTRMSKSSISCLVIRFD